MTIIIITITIIIINIVVVIYYYYYYPYCYQYAIIINIIGLYKKVLWQGLGVVAKLCLLDFNYCQNNRAEW